MTEVSTAKRPGSSSERSLSDLDVAVAHWHVNAWGGAEYLVTKLAEALDCDQVYTIGTPDPDEPNPYGDVTFYDVTQDLSPKPLRRLQSRIGRVFEYSLWEDVDWREYGYPDILVTSGATTRAVITPDDTLHVNYCHSTPRWFYDLYHDRKDSTTGILARPMVRYLRTRDATIDSRVDHYFVNSPIVERRLWKYYKRTAEVLYPPLDLDKYYDDGDDGFYLHLGRLASEKGIGSIVDAFAGTEDKLVLAGGKDDVPDRALSRIERGPNIEYRGFVSESEKYDLLASCRAVVFNGQNEDFGIVPMEANASNKACLARDEGYPGLFIEDGQNGYLHDGSPSSIGRAIERFERDGIEEAPTDAVEKFSTHAFEDQLTSTIVRRYEEFSATVC